MPFAAIPLSLVFIHIIVSMVYCGCVHFFIQIFIKQYTAIYTQVVRVCGSCIHDIRVPYTPRERERGGREGGRERERARERREALNGPCV